MIYRGRTQIQQQSGMDQAAQDILRELPPLYFQNFMEDPLSLLPHDEESQQAQAEQQAQQQEQQQQQQQQQTTAQKQQRQQQAPRPHVVSDTAQEDADPAPSASEAIVVEQNPNHERESSPPLTLSPSLALDAIPQLDRSVSTASSISSRRSSSSRMSDSGGPAAKRRGYMRPTVTNYSESAKNRESVMSLGSIAHLQYYFARTGLLDGKGAQFAREDILKRKPSSLGARSISGNSGDGSMEPQNDLLSPALAADSCAISDAGYTDSPTDQEGGEPDWDGDMMLPPTVSTYNQRPIYVAPLPDLTMLRRELTEALEEALKVLKDTNSSPDDTPGWYEIQGLHLLDIITLAIRAARNYYTAHTQPQRLYQFRSERDIRNDLYRTLEILKRMASRNFAGGIRQTEKVEILTWIVGISELMQSEIDQEKREHKEREKFRWRSGDWTGREREREELFLRSFMAEPQEMPTWTSPSDDSLLPTSFLEFFQNGLRLVKLHNEFVSISKRNFEEIKTWHTDTAKPYRMAENLRFWLKAAQLRWDITISLDVMAVVKGEDPGAWKQFDDALLQWCRGVREEIMNEWVDGKGTPGKKAPPTLRVVSTPTTPERTASSSTVRSLEVQSVETTAPVA